MAAKDLAPKGQRQHWAWISGWGIDPAHFQRAVQTWWPDVHHTVIAPTAGAIEQATALQPDVIAGYSLGTLLLLAAPLPPSSPPIVGVAPIFAFDAEAGFGGRTPGRARIALTGKFQKDAIGAVRLYLRLAGMADCFQDALPYAEADLAWGLEVLGTLRARPETIAQARLYAGQNDPLIDPAMLGGPGKAVQIIADCGHDYRTLLPQIIPFLSHAGL
jgi:hypothetical protein